MAEIITVARPYAEAVFRLAKEGNTLPQWSDVLSYLAAVVEHAEVRNVVANPKFTAQQVKGLINDILAERATAEVQNFIGVLVENARLSLLPYIAARFEELKAQHESVLDVQIASAFAVDAAQLAEITTQLEARYSKKINASVLVNAELIGGVKITVGDEVIDASVRGKLQAMAASLKI
jgi:F-type H+-transporting ATPase subunit delta